MTPEAVLSHPARVLTQEQRKRYFSDGYLAVESLFSPDEVARIRAVVDEFVERSRGENRSGTVFDLAPGHCADAPRIRRLRRPHEQHELFWEIATGVLADVAADVVGPDVVFHHSKLNFKWNDGHDQVDWHQDIQFYPHTNYSPLTIGLLLRDTAFEDGAVGFLPGTHAGELFDQYNDKGQWTGCLNARDVEKLDLGSAVYVEAPAGSITVHNCRTVHGSPPSTRSDGRPLLLNAYASADAFPYTPHPEPAPHVGEVIRGKRARWAHHDPRPCLIPPDWSGGYTSIFAAQAGEDGSGAAPDSGMG